MESFQCYVLRWLSFLEKWSGLAVASKVALGLALTVGNSLKAEDHPVVDFMVIYTANAKAILGSEAEVYRRAKQTEGFANQVFRNSEIDARLRLTHVAEVPYIERSSYSQDLTSLSNDFGISDLRNEYGADLVFLVRDGKSAAASALDDPEGDDEQVYFVIGGEISSGPTAGANFWGLCFGAGRDYDATNPGGLFEYSHAYRFVGSDGETYRTMTTLNNGRTIHRFSNPQLNVLGSPLGIESGNEGAADNARTIKEMAPIVAAYRNAGSRPPKIYSQSLDQRVTYNSISTLKVEALSSAQESYQWYEGVSGDTSRPILGAVSSEYTTDASSNSKVIWARVSNGHGSVDSDTINILVGDSHPEGELGELVDFSSTRLALWGSVLFPWQEFTPSASFHKSIDIGIVRSSADTSNRLLFRLRNGDGELLLSHVIAFEQISTLPKSWVRIPINRYLSPGEPHRFSLEYVDSVPDASADAIKWYRTRGDEDIYTEGRSSRDRGETGEFYDFAFRTWTVDHTIDDGDWLSLSLATDDLGSLNSVELDGLRFGYKYVLEKSLNLEDWSMVEVFEGAANETDLSLNLSDELGFVRVVSQRIQSD